MERPGWVKLGLWQINSRATAVFYLWFSVAIAALSVIAGLFFAPVLLWGVGILLASAWYSAAIKWVDRNGAWQKRA